MKHTIDSKSKQSHKPLEDEKLRAQQSLQWKIVTWIGSCLIRWWNNAQQLRKHIHNYDVLFHRKHLNPCIRLPYIIHAYAIIHHLMFDWERNWGKSHRLLMYRVTDLQFATIVYLSKFFQSKDLQFQMLHKFSLKSFP